MYLRFVNSTVMNQIKIKSIFKKVALDRKPDVDPGLNISIVSYIIQTM